MNNSFDGWSLTFDDFQLLKGKPQRTHLPFIAQLKYYQNNNGTFPRSFNDISKRTLKYLMDQLSITELPAYEWKERSAKRHRLEILEYLGIKKPSNDDMEGLSDLLIE